MNKEFFDALDEIAEEKGIPSEVVENAIESALLTAYKKSYGSDQNVRVEMDRENSNVGVYLRRDVVEEVENEDTEISIEEAREIDPDYEIGDYIDFEIEPAEFGRIAAQSARQVTQQRFKEAERNIIYEDFYDKIGEVLTGKVQRIQRETIYVNIGRAEGILMEKEQVPGERFSVNDRIKVYITNVKKTTKGPQVFLSRSHPNLVGKLFEMEVPEIEEGLVEIKNIAREPGSRTKIAVYTEDENIDPVGACVGSRGGRVQAVVDELFNEKIDIITWSDDPAELIRNVLSPASVEEVIIDEEENMATVVVPDHQLSLAIGKSGQNVRLAAKLCGWKIDIKSHTQFEEEYEFIEVTEEEMPDDEAAETVTDVNEDEEIVEIPEEASDDE
jgi:N utilization substance protein A